VSAVAGPGDAATGPGSRPPPERRRPSERLAVAIASLAFAGFFPVAPATFASAIATVFFAFVFPLPAVAAVALVVALIVIGVWSCGRLESVYGHDPSAAVLDEVCGMAVTLAFGPITPATLVLGFLLFRVFDVLKLPPGRAAERLPGGWGVVFDDVVAGVYAAAVLRGCMWLWPGMHLALWHLGVLAVGAAVLFVFRKPLFRRYGKPRTRLGVRRGTEAR